MKKILLRISISLVFLGLLFYFIREDIPQILNVLSNANKKLLLVGALIYLGTAFILAKRMQLIFLAKEVPMKFADALNLTFVGYFFNNFLPTSVGGDIVKAMSAARITKSPVKSVSCVLMDRIFGLFTFIIIPSIGLLFVLHGAENRKVQILVYSFLFISVASSFLIFHRSTARRFRFLEKTPIGPKIRLIYEDLHNFKNHPIVVAQALALSLVGQSVNIFVLYLYSIAMGAKGASLLHFFLLIPVVHLLSMVPSINGLGIREYGYAKLLGPYIGREYAAAIGILWLALLLLASVIGGIIYMIRHDYHIRFTKATVTA